MAQVSDHRAHAEISQSINELLEKLNADFERNPLDLRVDALSTLLEKSLAYQKKLSDAEKEQDKDSGGMLRRKIIILSIAISAVAAATIGIAQSDNNGNQPMLTSISDGIAKAVAGLGATFLFYIDEKANKQEQTERLKREKERIKREEELPERVLLALVKGVSTAKSWQRKKNQQQTPREFQECVDNLKKIPRTLKKRIPKRDKWLANLINSLPETDPIKMQANNLSKIAMEINRVRMTPTIEKKENEEGRGKEEKEIAEEETKGKERKEERKFSKEREGSGIKGESASDSSPKGNLRDSPPSIDRTLTSPLEPSRLELEYQGSWEKLQALLGMQVKSLQLGQLILKQTGEISNVQEDEEIKRMLDGYHQENLPSPLRLKSSYWKDKEKEEFERLTSTSQSSMTSQSNMASQSSFETPKHFQFHSFIRSPSITLYPQTSTPLPSMTSSSLMPLPNIGSSLPSPLPRMTSGTPTPASPMLPVSTTNKAGTENTINITISAPTL